MLTFVIFTRTSGIKGITRKQLFWGMGNAIILDEHNVNMWRR